MVVAVCVLWLLALVWPVVLLTARRPRPAAGCYRCHYDLRGNTSGVCPECGTPVAPPTDSGRAIQTPRSVVALAAGFGAAAIAVHASFAAVHLGYILDPANSPYGHENAFGDAPRYIGAWCVQAPAWLAGIGLICVTLAVLPGRPPGRQLRSVVASWVTCTAALFWLTIVDFWWFFD
jgi:hypothetical protein